MIFPSRCAAHSLNLVAASDCQDALDDNKTEYYKLHRKTFAKLTKLWSYYNQSTKFADLVKDKFSKTLVTPSPTRWNSTYDSAKRVTELREQDSAAFTAMFKAAKVKSI